MSGSLEARVQPPFSLSIYDRRASLYRYTLLKRLEAHLAMWTPSQ